MIGCIVFLRGRMATRSALCGGLCQGTLAKVQVRVSKGLHKPPSVSRPEVPRGSGDGADCVQRPTGCLRAVILPGEAFVDKNTQYFNSILRLDLVLPQGAH